MGACEAVGCLCAVCRFALDLPGQVQYVLCDGVGQLALTRIDACHRLGPSFWMRDRKVDDVALADMTRHHQRGQHRETGSGVLQVCPKTSASQP